MHHVNWIYLLLYSYVASETVTLWCSSSTYLSNSFREKFKCKFHKNILTSNEKKKTQ